MLKFKTCCAIGRKFTLQMRIFCLSVSLRVIKSVECWVDCLHDRPSLLFFSADWTWFILHQHASGNKLLAFKKNLVHAMPLSKQQNDQRATYLLWHRLLSLSELVSITECLKIRHRHNILCFLNYLFAFIIHIFDGLSLKSIYPILQCYNLVEVRLLSMVLQWLFMGEFY